MRVTLPLAVIGQRAKTRPLVDQIIVLEHGTVAEQPGTHEQLINSGGVYSSLWGEKAFAIDFRGAIADDGVLF